MRERARSAEDKAARAEALLTAAEELALELGGVRFVTVAAVADRAGLHRTGTRRYFAGREEMLLQLAERGWGRWRDAVAERLARRSPAGGPAPDLTAEEVADVLAGTLVTLPVLCDLLAHVALSLEGDADVEAVRRYKTAVTRATDDLADLLAGASALTPTQVRSLLLTASLLVAGLWQMTHPTASLAALYAQVPEWAHAPDHLQTRLTTLLRATATGLASGHAPVDRPGA